MAGVGASCQRGAHRHQRSPGCRPGKPHCKIRRRQVVADRFGERQELGRQLDAHRVRADVLRPRVAAAVAEKAGHRRRAADFQLAAEHVFGLRQADDAVGFGDANHRQILDMRLFGQHRLDRRNHRRRPGFSYNGPARLCLSWMPRRRRTRRHCSKSEGRCDELCDRAGRVLGDRSCGSDCCALSRPSPRAAKPDVPSKRPGRSTGCSPRKSSQSDTKLAPRVDDATYLRRVWLDIVGDIPTPEHVTAFLLDPAPDKRERVVRELLANPQYGQNWARYWRDVILLPPAGRPRGDRRQSARRRAHREVQRERAVGQDRRRVHHGHGRRARRTARRRFTWPRTAAPKKPRPRCRASFSAFRFNAASVTIIRTTRWKREQFHELAAFFPRIAVRPVHVADAAQLRSRGRRPAGARRSAESGR